MRWWVTKNTHTTQKKKMTNKTSTQNKTYSYEDIAVYRHTHTDITSYDKIGLVRSLSGITCIGIGLITTPVPMTTIPLIMVGSWLLGYDGKVLVAKTTYKLKLLINWVYANRTPKKIIQTLKVRLLVC